MGCSKNETDNIKKIFELEIMKYAPTSPNRSVYASPPYGGSGYEKPQSGYALCAVLSSPQFGQGSMLRIALLPAQTVVNSRNVMCNTP